jgi:peptidoglycan hydrolase CwlO-like protein
VLVLVALTVAPVVGFEATTPVASAGSVDDLRSSIDEVAQQWFDAQAHVRDLDAKIAATQQQIDDLERRARELQQQATKRAVDMYVGDANRFGEVFDQGTAIDSARRVELIGRANARSTQTFEALSELTEELEGQRDALQASRDELGEAQDDLERNRAALGGELEIARRDAAQVATARRARPDASGGSETTTGPTGGPTSSPPAADPTTSSPPPPPAVTAPAPPAPPVAPVVASVHPMHDHPFLVCTRSRESRGIYTIVSASGLYYGAYQFLRDTWDVTALHAGRGELVGVPPNTASEYDQDDLAWVLYQWQGNDPWGGRC